MRLACHGIAPCNKWDDICTCLGPQWVVFMPHNASKSTGVVGPQERRPAEGVAQVGQASEPPSDEERCARGDACFRCLFFCRRLWVLDEAKACMDSLVGHAL